MSQVSVANYSLEFYSQYKILSKLDLNNSNENNTIKQQKSNIKLRKTHLEIGSPKSQQIMKLSY